MKDCNIGSIANTMRIFASLYSDNRAPLRELVTNSIDAEATRIDVKIEKDSISVMDNGEGLTADDMDRIATSIASSIKAENPDKIGKWGIGLCASLGLGEYTTLESQKDIYDSAGIKLVFGRYCSFGDDDCPSEIIIPKRYTTKVTIHNIKEEVKRIGGKRLSNYFTDQLSKNLKDKRIDFFVEDKKGKHPVEVLRYEGERYRVRFKDTIEGRIDIDIRFLSVPNMKKKITLTSKDGTLEDITRKESFSNEPWNSDILHGNINAEFLNVTANRDDFVDDESWRILSRELKKEEADLNGDIKNKKAIRKEKEDKKSKKNVTKILNEWLSAMPNLELNGTRKKGEKPEDKGGVFPPKQKPSYIIKPIKEPTNAPKGDKLTTGHSHKVTDLNDPDLRTTRKDHWILVNRTHRDYQLLSGKPSEKDSYIAEMVMQEIVLEGYKDRDAREYMQAMQECLVTKHKLGI